MVAYRQQTREDPDLLSISYNQICMKHAMFDLQFTMTLRWKLRRVKMPAGMYIHDITYRTQILSILIYSHHTVDGHLDTKT